MAQKLSFSHLKAYETCPRKYAEVKVYKRFVEPPTEAATFGEQLHKAAELYVKEKLEPTGPHAFMRPIIDALLRKGDEALAEEKFGVRSDLSNCDFFDEAVWMRGIADLVVLDRNNKRAFVVDYKTGSPNYAEPFQLTLMALFALNRWPEINQVYGALLFVMKGRTVKTRLDRDGATVAWDTVREKSARIDVAMHTDIWNPLPSGLCRRHCPVTTCEHHGG